MPPFAIQPGMGPGARIIASTLPTPRPSPSPQTLVTITNFPTIDALIVDVTNGDVLSVIFISNNIVSGGTSDDTVQRVLTWKKNTKQTRLETNIILPPSIATIQTQLVLETEGIKLYLCHNISMLQDVIDELTMSRVLSRRIVNDEGDINIEIFQCVERICGPERAQIVLKEFSCIANVADATGNGRFADDDALTKIFVKVL